MRVTPISEEKAVNAFAPWPTGDYEFEVADVSDEISKTGNEMIKLTLELINSGGQRKKCFDYLLNGDAHGWKVRHFAASVGMLAQYEAGSMDVVEIQGRAGRAAVRSVPERNGFQAKNEIKDYLPPPQGQAAKPRKALNPAADLDDDIPF